MRIGLFGTGWWARDVHGPALARSSDVELVGVWGRDPAKRAALADPLGVAAYAEPADLIADVEAVAIALPPDLQGGLALQAARAGRHLLLEKPLAFDLDQADEIVRLVDEQGLASVVFFTGRYQPAAEDVIARALDAGGWTGAHADLQVAALTAPDAILHASPWRVARGALWDLAPHGLSPLVAVLGPVRRVVAQTDDRHGTQLLLRHAGGASSTLVTTLQAPPAAFSWRIEFFGETGRVTVPHDVDEADRYFERAIAELVAIAAGRAQPRVDVVFARHVVAIAVAAERSIRSGQVEDVPG